MSIISEIKCAKCDRMYSGIRSRCPYCSTRRIARGKYSEDSDRAKGKMLIAVLVMAVFVVITGVLLFTTEVPEEEEQADISSEPSPEEPSDPLVTDDGIISLPGQPIEPPDTTEDPPVDETPPPNEVQSVTVTYGRNRLPGAASGNPELTLKMSEESIQLNVSVMPEGFEEAPVWESSNPEIFEVTPTSPEATVATIRAIGVGNATLTVSAGGVSQRVIIRIS